MPKRGPNRRKKVPKLSFTENQGIGWHVSYRDPSTGLPRRHRFGIFPPGDPRVASALALRGELLLHERAYAAAEPILRECLAVRGQVSLDGGPQAWTKYNAASMLGEAIVGLFGDPHTRPGSEFAAPEPTAPTTRPAADPRARLREAERLLLDGYNGMEDQAHLPAPARPGGADRKRKALERIVRLYETWNGAEPGKGYDAKATEWRGRLDALPTSTRPASPGSWGSMPLRTG